MKHVLFAALSLSLVTACGGGSETFDKQAAPPPPPPMAMVEEAAPAEFKRNQSEFDDQTSSPADPSEPVSTEEQFIAYSYARGLRLPKDAVDPTLQAHLNACLAAGPSKCIVLNSNIYKPSDDYIRGELSIRAVPDWIETFMATIESDAEGAGGEITSRSTRAEDLTRAILDTDARLQAQITLQTRLRNLLSTREGELRDLLEIERELARVTGQIESIKSNLKAMRLRVSMSRLDVSYESKSSVINPGRENPLARAFGDFFYNFAGALAAVINAFAFGLPWLFLIGVLMFIWLRAIWPWVKRRRKTE